MLRSSRPSIFVAVLLLSLVAYHYARATPPPVSKQKHHTQVRLLADVQSIQPGSSFRLGFLMTMDPGWHTYWKNAGDAGLAPEMKWTLPAGFEVGEIQWPLPHKYNEGEDILTYGYEKENMLIIPVNAGTGLRPGTRITIKCDANWLECEKLCIPGNGLVEITLTVETAKPLPANTALFNHYAELIPLSFSSRDVALSFEARDRAIELRLTPSSGNKLEAVRDTAPDFYPEQFDDLQTGRTEVRAAPDGAVLRVPLSLYERGKSPDTFRGVLVYRLESGMRGFGLVEIPLSKEFVASLHVIGEKVDITTGLLDRTFNIEGSANAGDPLVLYILFALIGGLLLNIMPCVLPVIGLKVFGLIRMGGEHPGQVRRLGWFFSLGILASFLTLAVLVIVLKSAGEQVGWGFQFQEPVFVIVMSTVVLIFGLSLFGVFEIRLPSSAISGVGQMIGRAGVGGSSSLGSFSEGVFATILATPCTAPILGTALGFAFAQPPLIILVMFTSVAAGMAFPYFLMTLKPAWMRFLPKPGAWMETAKQFMGFLMIATLLWLLYILGKQLGMEAVIWTSAFLLTIGLGCWLIGKFSTLTASRGKVVFTWALSIVVCLLGYWLFLQPVIEAREVVGDGSAGVLENSQTESKGIPWEPFSIASLEQHLQDGKPVFIDFTAEWCLTCKVNEKRVFSDETVIDRFKAAGLVSMRADWTKRNPDITRLLLKFGRSGVPLYVIFPAGKPNEPIVLPEVITSGIVIEGIGKATE